MENWHKTTCVLCPQNCGLEVKVENNRIVKVRGDKDNPRSQGYICNKGLNIAYHQHTSQRLKYPLKRVGDDWVRISWEQAVKEITAKIRELLDKYGPRSIAYMGGGGVGCHFEAAFGLRFLRSLGSQNYYSPLGQELTGSFWVQGRALGKQYLATIPDHQRADMFLAVGWNGMRSHQTPRAPVVLREIAKDPNKLLVVVDPRRSETAAIADIHLPVRPGTDALLFKAMISIILMENWHNKEYIEKHVCGFENIVSMFENFDAKKAVEVCELDYNQVREVAYLFATRKSCLHRDLGILMNRHSTATSYLLEVILPAICGRLCVPGGNVIPGYLMPLGSHTDERDPKYWRTVATNMPLIMGVFPPNVLPEEILNDHPERIRGVIVTQSNPLRSYADTAAYEKAFRELELLVTMEINMTETAKLSHYVLPSRSGYESYDSTFFAWTYPEIYFTMRRPIIEPEGEPLEISQIFVKMAEEMGFIPAIPLYLKEAAIRSRKDFAMSLMQYIKENPKAASFMPFVLAKTLGEVWGSANLAALWGILQGTGSEFKKAAARAGFAEGPWQGDEIFEAIMKHPEGLFIGKLDPEDNFAQVKTEDRKINIFIPELEEWVKSITPEAEKEALKPDPRYPLILNAGRHSWFNANTLMRNPEWLKGKRACTLAMHPEDAQTLNLKDGQLVKVITEAGEEIIELEVSDEVRKGQVIIPHGFGLEYEGRTYGINVNRLTRSTHRDPFAGTPLHRYVPCRVEPVPEEGK
ncbi:Anaerobic selenocysteine-containing dehydrogenase [Thermosyntropha lipolytica DSM 11003]|uniref:Anaerobic selenocysteine-containing dehydrogenase n=1 Tax=Thermosyntropha lipolytica DSM 11003 TaxID=1123382 RepID=A0A1M5RPN8_9FIRM|nr:molybdopterin-dependent oxidoreductase [Thermosyntropha lipolytica]SHH28234.1 Anaerobic selenocysteine-containing dehydrogenase [Thermosyntropha lipolytica DSM 11003]